MCLVNLTTITARLFSRRPADARRTADLGPVIITDGGAPTHVLLTFADYQRLEARPMSVAEALAGPAELDFDFDPPRLRDDIFRSVDFGEDPD